MMYLWASRKKKIWENNILFCNFNQWRKELDPDPDALVRDMDPGIRIHTKMSRIPNTGHNLHNVELRAVFWEAYLLIR